MHAAVTVAARDHVEAEGCRIFAKVLHGAAIDPDLSVAKVSRREVTATEAERAAQRAAERAEARKLMSDEYKAMLDN
ncbi:hypothetical protein Ctob_004686 [Chrysochromulina tobinii]|uniref:Uncharacterized protein n=1 Tax=Chrysochromulina tobinii TaxID=1460289 RepID=A0A0M0JYJ4_9EUKA|nr:hypothetical protein Ctob_004686 [Chrysochromulina tobinii]|eukprot:KOO31203.1 hypothetical protein Ctob_004686 [Chrysochromulina sp. CCMP291]